MQFRVDLTAFQGAFPQAYWLQVKEKQRRNAVIDAVTATEFPAKCASGILETHSNNLGGFMEISGVRMLIGLLIGIALLIVLMLKTKIQAFLALILCTIVVGVVGGMPLTATDIVNASGEAKSGVSIVNSIIGGFGGTLGNIGIIIGFGVMLGQIFAVSGAAKRMAYTFLNCVARTPCPLSRCQH